MRNRLNVWVSVLLAVSILVAMLCVGNVAVSAESGEQSNEQIIYDFLKTEMGLNTAAACGVLANIEHESGFRHDVVEYGYTWETGGGFGICQWTNYPRTSPSGRRTSLVEFCEENGYDYRTLEGQLYYLKHELNTPYYYNLVMRYLLAAEDTADGVYMAAYRWCYFFEVPAGYDTGVSEERGEYAKSTYWVKYAEDPYTYTSVADGIYYLKNNSAGTYWRVEEDADAANVQLHSFLGDSGQQIALTATENGYTMRPLCSESRLIGPNGDAVAAGTRIQLQSAANDMSQLWKFESTAEGIVIHSVQAPKCALDVDRDGNVIVQSRSDADTQIWLLENAVTYDANGGEGAPPVQMKTYGEVLTVSSAIPVREGYVFVGWSLDASSTTADYSAGSEYTANADTTLYAVWRAADTVAPVISDVMVWNIRSTGYTVTCTVTDDVEIDRVVFPTWTEHGGQDDIKWIKGTISGSAVTFHVNTIDHNFEAGTYHTHIYAYDTSGNFVGYPVKVEVPAGSYQIGDVTLDGLIDLDDASRLFYYVNSLVTLTGESWNAADINGDNVVDLDDASRLFYFINGLF